MNGYKGKYKSALLNNTKWREIISILAKHLKYPIEVAYIDTEKYTIGFIPAEEKLMEDYIVDPGFLTVFCSLKIGPFCVRKIL